MYVQLFVASNVARTRKLSAQLGANAGRQGVSADRGRRTHFRDVAPWRNNAGIQLQSQAACLKGRTVIRLLSKDSVSVEIAQTLTYVCNRYDKGFTLRKNDM